MGERYLLISHKSHLHPSRKQNSQVGNFQVKSKLQQQI